MHVDIVKKDGKISLENMQCICGYGHNIPDIDIYIKRGLISGCADCIAGCGFGKNVLIIADSITYGIAAGDIETSLKSAGYSCRMCILPGENIEPTPENAEYIVSRSKGADFLLGVGSGVVTDLTRRASTIADLPFAVFGTAASMDAYTSVTSAMVEDGMKRTRYGKAARLLMFDPAIIASAPLTMHASGVGDMFAKYNVLVDWRLGHAVTGEKYCPLCAHLVSTALDVAASNIDEIAARTQTGAEALTEALILGGMSILIVGDTRPCSSIEHNIAHFFEMIHIAYGTAHISHGLGAGLGLIYALLFHEALKNAGLKTLDRQSIKASRMTKEEKAQLIRRCYPPGVGEEVMASNKYWYLEWPEQEKRIDNIVSYHEEYKLDCKNLPDRREIKRVLEMFGAPTSATKAGLDMDTLEKTLLGTGNFRPRYNISLALSELNMLEDTVKNILEIEKTL